MRFMLILSAVALLTTSYGCSCVSTVERANLTPAVTRAEYIRLHPDASHNDCIRNGEIVRGMSAHEVVASWGLPNVYVLTRSSPSEQWIYYIKDRDSLAMLVYTLGFADDTLRVWTIDQKRDVGQGIVSVGDNSRQTPATSARDLRRK
jgi:hypothetical protein